MELPLDAAVKSRVGATDSCYISLGLLKTEVLKSGALELQPVRAECSSFPC